MGRDTSFGYLSPLGKCSAFLGTDWVGNGSGDILCSIVLLKSQGCKR